MICIAISNNLEDRFQPFLFEFGPVVSEKIFEIVYAGQMDEEGVCDGNSSLDALGQMDEEGV